jgi:cytochrome c oxidase assembly factor CtaG/cytochrome c2
MTLGAVLTPTLLAAHEGRAFEAHDLLTEWVWDPLIVAPIALSAWLYAAGSGRAEGLMRWEKTCFWSGWASLMLALMSPLHPMGESLFSAHMAQHEIIMVLSAPLLVLGRPLVAFLWALPQPARRSVGSLGKAAWIRHPWEYLTRPLVAFAIHFAAVWAWHLPAAYDASVTSEAVHTAQHASFLGSALLFWWAAIRQHIGRKHYGPGLFYIFVTAVHTSILGALLTFSNFAWYSVYQSTVGAWGLTPLEDQQLGGLIMWVPPAFIYLAIFLGIFTLWMNDRGAPRHLRSGLTTLAIAAISLTLAGCANNSVLIPSEMLHGTDRTRGKELLQAYGCHTCHTIPGIPGAAGTVGPPLSAVGRRTYLAGRITNTPENMTRWIHDPKSVDEKTAMPVTGITESEARHVVRYLFSLR